MNDLRIEMNVKKVDFNIHPAMMDAGLGHYGEIILALLEDYGFKSGDWDKGKKYTVEKERHNLKPDEQLEELKEALTLIFKLLKCFRKTINEG